jgi:hypothetical protein
VLLFEGCAFTSRITNLAGFVVECDMGLDDTCVRRQYLPDETGRLPNEYDDLCLVTDNTPTDTPTDLPTDTEPFSPSAVLPYTDDFDDCDVSDWFVAGGDWDFASDDSPDEQPSDPPNVPSLCSPPSTTISLQATNLALRNTLLWDAKVEEASVLVTADVKLLQGPDGARRNAGLVLRYQSLINYPSLTRFFYLYADHSSLTFSVQLYQAGVVQILKTVHVPSLSIGQWYRIEGHVLQQGSSANLTATLTALEGTPWNASFSVTLAQAYLDQFGGTTAKYGIGTIRASSLFSWFRVEERF